MQQIDHGVAVLTLIAGHYLAAKLVGHEVQPVADAENRHAEMQYLLVGRRRVLVVDGTWASRENDTRGPMAPNFFQPGGAGKDDRENVLLANTACDELRVLRAEIEDDDGLGFHYLGCQREQQLATSSQQLVNRR